MTDGQRKRMGAILAAASVLVAAATVWSVNRGDGTEAYAANIATVAAFETEWDKTTGTAEKTVLTATAVRQTDEEPKASYGSAISADEKENDMQGITGAKRRSKKYGNCEWLCLDVPKRKLKHTTEPEFREFCETVVKDSGYSWVSVFCGDGTGIQFVGSFAGTAEYGRIDKNGQLDEVLGYILLEDGTYRYVDADEAE